MKKIIYKISLGLFLIGAAGCKKQITINPTHLATLENAFKEMKDYENGLSAVYNSMRGVGYYGRNMSALPDMSTDNN